MAVISESLNAFLQQRRSSAEQIDIVLLLRADAARSWTAPEVAAALDMPPESAAMRLFLIASTGLVTFEASGIPRYRYAPADAQTEALLDELASVYPAHRNTIAAMLGGAPADPIRSFADAFKLKK
ncbi:MAG TPA: hypothetical protein VFN10_20360 [Thermoanaerobaculia bacterium]|nr:hypothetical protein [Thermoanaerobaculia bacterium]